MRSLDAKKLLEVEKRQQEEQGDAAEEKSEVANEGMELDEEFYKEQAQLEKFKKLFEGKYQVNILFILFAMMLCIVSFV